LPTGWPASGRSRNQRAAENLYKQPDETTDQKIIVTTPSNPVNRRRSERVMLRIRILVSAEDTARKRQQEEALTQVVNAHGGLIKMKMELHVGQPMLLLNPQNKVQQSCRVVRVEDTAEGDYAVAFEFDEPNPKFWPIVFPPADWNAPRA
jgi:hypothetical protein